MDYTYLGKLNREQLKALDSEGCARLCSEIRGELVSRVLENGGHLASNLGVVELTLAIHRIFDLPDDRVIFDVGHQSYVHKMLSDRFDRFGTLRMPGGLSGFQRRDESAFDAFGGGHASTSLSAAVGFAEADRLQEKENYTVCVVGDGAFTGGMIHEALNNCSENLHLIIILNENEMSISRNTGHFAEALTRMRSTSGYFNFKRRTKKLLSKTFVGRKLRNFSARQKSRIKRAVYSDNYFDLLGIDYMGPVDGHNLSKLELLLSEAKKNCRCTLLHVRTVKGKGYAPAEENPGKYHGVAPAVGTDAPTFSCHVGARLTELAQTDRKLCAVTAAMASGTGLTPFFAAHPARFFDVGIAEEHAMTFCAALSASGMHPVFAVYSTFLQRCFDQLINDAALQRLPITVAVDRAGLAPFDGPTHHGVFDVSMALCLPGATIYSPLDFKSADLLLDRALSEDAISFVRYPSGGEIKAAAELPYIYNEGFVRGKVENDPDGLIITYGQLACEALLAAETAKKEGKRVSVVALESLPPTEDILHALLSLLSDHTKILFAEEGIGNGGAGELYAEKLGNLGRKVSVLAINDPFVLAKEGQTVYETYGISSKDMLSRLNI